MSDPIIGLQQWCESPPGRYLLGREQTLCDATVADIFGFHALQLGLPALDALRNNRMPHRWLAVDGCGQIAAPATAVESGAEPAPQDNPPARAALVCDFRALPFPAESLDLVILPHTLEFSGDAHATLREVQRVLVPEGRLVISIFNAASLWGWCHLRTRMYHTLGLGRCWLPLPQGFIGYPRLRDWLSLLSFEIQQSHFGGYRPAVRSERCLQRWRGLDNVGARCWPILGATCVITATKRVAGMRLIAPAWKSRKTAVGSKTATIIHGREARRNTAPAQDGFTDTGS